MLSGPKSQGPRLQSLTVRVSAVCRGGSAYWMSESLGDGRPVGSGSLVIWVRSVWFGMYADDGQYWNCYRHRHRHFIIFQNNSTLNERIQNNREPIMCVIQKHRGEAQKWIPEHTWKICLVSQFFTAWFAIVVLLHSVIGILESLGLWGFGKRYNRFWCALRSEMKQWTVSNQ